MGKRTGRPRGRPAGARNKRTTELQARMEEAAIAIGEVIPNAFAGDAHSLLVAIYKDPRLDLDSRLDAAKAAIRYEKPALAAVEHSGNEDKPVVVQKIERVIVRPSDSNG